MIDPQRAAGGGDYGRQLRDVNEALLVSSVHQHELAEKAQKAEAALRESEDRFRAIADHIPQLAWMADAAGNVDWFNRGWLEYTGTTLQENLGVGWKSVHHPDHVDAVAEKFERHLREGRDWEDTFPLRGKDGHYRWFLSRMNAIRDDLGKIVRFFGTNTDVTERFEMENQIKKQAEQLAEESRRKDEFLAMLSHELRNPLAPIRSAIHLLRLQERGSENLIQQQAQDIIERQVTNLTCLIGDLLEVSRVITGRIRLRIELIDLNQVVAHAIQTTTPLIEQHRHELVLHRCSEPAWVNADATRLEEVFVNLLNNAVKYTNEGGRIEVGCRISAAQTHAVVRVRDNGIGIEAKLLRDGVIFDLFTQADRSLDRAAGGLGIGLSLARRLVELHSGTIEATSPPEGSDNGSEFVVRLPLATAQKAGAIAPVDNPSQNSIGMRVLVVDDNIDHVTMLSTSLQHMGYSVQTAYTGPDGLKVATQWRPDVVLLDVGLPGLDGYEVAKRLRSAAFTKSMRLIAITGYASEVDIAAARQAGFDAHLSKPVEFSRLEKLMSPNQTQIDK